MNSLQGPPAPPREIHVIDPRESTPFFGKTHRIARIGTQGYGSCFFHALLLAINYENFRNVSDERQRTLADEFRCSFMHHTDQLLSTTDEDAIQSIAETWTLDMLEEKFCNPESWADDPLIRIASRVLGINIVFINGTAVKFHCGTHGQDPHVQPTVVILWVERRHFEPIVHLYQSGKLEDKDSKTIVQGVLYPSMTDEEARVVDSLLEEYKDQCNVSLENPSDDMSPLPRR